MLMSGWLVVMQMYLCDFLGRNSHAPSKQRHFYSTPLNTGHIAPGKS